MNLQGKNAFSLFSKMKLILLCSTFILKVFSQRTGNQCRQHSDCFFLSPTARCNFALGSSALVGLCELPDGSVPDRRENVVRCTESRQCPVGQSCGSDGICKSGQEGMVWNGAIIALVSAAAVLVCGLSTFFVCFGCVCCSNNESGKRKLRSCFRFSGENEIKDPAVVVSGNSAISHNINGGKDGAAFMQVQPRDLENAVPASVANTDSTTNFNHLHGQQAHSQITYAEVIEIMPAPKLPQFSQYPAINDVYSSLPLPNFVEDVSEVPKKHFSKRISVNLGKPNRVSSIISPTQNDSQSQAPDLISRASLLLDSSKNILDDTPEPPRGPGFFAFWDNNGRFHQGYNDEYGNTFGGVFDEEGMFHFGVFGSTEPVRVARNMFAKEFGAETNIESINHNIVGRRSSQETESPLDEENIKDIENTYESTGDLKWKNVVSLKELVPDQPGMRSAAESMIAYDDNE